MKLRRRFLTLLETLIVMFILSLVLGLVGINVNKAVHDQRFRTDVSTVVDSLRIAQYLMLILDNDVHVKFKQSDNGIIINIETACPLSGNWAKILLAPKHLHTVHVVNFKDRLQSQPAESGIVDIRFLSSGYVMSQGIMRLATANATLGQEGLENYICLPGYPSAIASVEKRPEEPACYALLEEGFVENMTSLMVMEIQNLEAAKKPEEQKKEEAPKEPVKDEKQKTK